MPASRIVLVAAMANNRAIGRQNTLPWRLPGDMRLFRENTLGKTILMGRNTAHSIGAALPKRKNLVLTSGDAVFPGQTKVRTMAEAIELSDSDDLVVIGGQQVYTLALPYAAKMCLTYVDLDVPNADTFFPEFDQTKWRTTRYDRFPVEGNYPAYTYVEHQRPALLLPE